MAYNFSQDGGYSPHRNLIINDNHELKFEIEKLKSLNFNLRNQLEQQLSKSNQQASIESKIINLKNDFVNMSRTLEENIDKKMDEIKNQLKEIFDNLKRPPNEEKETQACLETVQLTNQNSQTDIDHEQVSQSERIFQDRSTDIETQMEEMFSDIENRMYSEPEGFEEYHQITQTEESRNDLHQMNYEPGDLEEDVEFKEEQEDEQTFNDCRQSQTEEVTSEYPQGMETESADEQPIADEPTNSQSEEISTTNERLTSEIDPGLKENSNNSCRAQVTVNDNDCNSASSQKKKEKRKDRVQNKVQCPLCKTTINSNYMKRHQVYHCKAADILRCPKVKNGINKKSIYSQTRMKKQIEDIVKKQIYKEVFKKMLTSNRGSIFQGNSSNCSQTQDPVNHNASTSSLPEEEITREIFVPNKDEDFGNKKQHKPLIFICKYCDKKYDSNRSLDIHTAKSHNMKKCPYCQKYRKSSYLNNHKKYFCKGGVEEDVEEDVEVDVE